jgi:glycerol-3-phosphate dehydrogenase (NAD(P)+)
MPKIAVIGTTTWGITLGTVFSQKKLGVSLWARTEKEACSLKADGPRLKRLPDDFRFPPHLTITSSIENALDGADAVILAVPSQSMRRNIKLASPYITSKMLVISAAKGLEIETGKRMSQVIAEEINKDFWYNICVLSGPNLAWEILHGHPAVTIVAADKNAQTNKAHKLLTAPNFCAYTNTDVIGVELGGALKNIIALGAGIVDGLGYGDNAKAALITRGLTEITAMGTALGANPLTFSGLAGLGDLIATCESNLSRNHYVGVELTKGRSLEEIMKTMDCVAEGVNTTSVAHHLAQQMELEMPITERIYQVLYENADPRKATTGLMSAAASHELAGRKWKLFSLFRRRRKNKAG